MYKGGAIQNKGIFNDAYFQKVHCDVHFLSGRPFGLTHKSELCYILLKYCEDFVLVMCYQIL